MWNIPTWYLFVGFVTECCCCQYRIQSTLSTYTAPHSRVFASVYSKLHETGALPSSYISSERATVQNVVKAESILQSVERSPTSTRRISTHICVQHTRVRRTVLQHGLYPLHVQMVQRLEEGYEFGRFDLCRRVIANRRSIPFTLYTDEASSTRDGTNNTHNSQRWSDKYPHVIVGGNSVLCKCVVWCD
jgi:hypothetical protein